MARYTGPTTRLSRREGQNLYLKGDRSFSNKDDFAKRPYAPGQHGKAGVRRKMSEYGMQLREKQKTKRFYGLQEKQFHKLYQEADRMRGNTATNFLSLLELRFDNIAYRLGLASSRAQARQRVSHAHFTVNGKKVNIPSITLNAGDVIEVAEGSRDLEIFKELTANHAVPEWLSFDADNLKGTVVRTPGREDVDLEVQERLIVELYSR